MRVLLSTIGSRGDVQPLLALALALRNRGHTARLCVPPDFADLVGGYGLEFAPMGYVFADYNPQMLPSPHHAPPPLPGRPFAAPDVDNRALWELDDQRRNATWAAPLYEHRAAAGQPPVTDVRGHVLTDRPLLAADPVLAPWPAPSDLDVLQAGAWVVADRRPLPAGLEAFLRAGDAPVHFGFGSMREPARAARPAGRHGIVQRHQNHRRYCVSKGVAPCLATVLVDPISCFSRSITYSWPYPAEGRTSAGSSGVACWGCTKSTNHRL